MHDAAPRPQLPALRPAEQPTLPTTQPELAELFAFMAQAELRFDSLRMRIVDRRITTHGEEVETHEIWLRHPNRAKVVSGRGQAIERDFGVWVCDGERVHTYNAKGNTGTNRRLPVRPVGVDDPDLPSFSQVYIPVTTLPAETLADTFVHPQWLLPQRARHRPGHAARYGCLANGREAILLRCDHPRTSHVLTDRPDHWLEVGVDLQTGMLLLLAEHVGEQTTRHAEVVSLALDEAIPDEAFTLHVSADTRMLY